MIINSNGYRFRRGTGSPFDAQPNTSFDLGGTEQKPVQWCTHCMMEVRVNTAAYNQNQVWGKKHWCQRCGGVTASAVYFHVGSLMTPETPLLKKAMAWAATPEHITK